MAAPLSNIRVLDMSRILAGPWAGQLLGDYGADVVKLERPGSGDDTRSLGAAVARRKQPAESRPISCPRIATSDLSRSILPRRSGQDVVKDLAAKADVLLENYRVGTLSRFGLGPGQLRAINPGLIYCSISAFGQRSSRAEEPGYDAMIQASAGLMSITGPKGGEPQKVGVAIADIMAGMYATTAVLAALHARSETGQGQHIDVPLYDSQVAWLANQNMNYLVGGQLPQRMGTAHPNLVPYQAFSTADGHLMLAVGNDRQFMACMTGIGQAELGTDKRFARNRDRIANRGELVALLERAFSTQTTAHWLDVLRGLEVPAGPINDIGEVLGNAFAEERGLVRELRYSGGQATPTVANPVDFSETPVRYDRAPPLLGEHTGEVLREWLGYSDVKIEELRAASAIG